MSKFITTFAILALYAESKALAQDICMSLIPLLDPTQKTEEVYSTLNDYQKRKTWIISGSHYTLSPARTKTYKVDLSIDTEGFQEKSESIECSLPVSWELETNSILTPIVPAEFNNHLSPSGSQAVPFAGGWKVFGGIALNNEEFGKNYSGIAWQMEKLTASPENVIDDLKLQYPYLKDVRILKNEILGDEAHDSVIAIGFKTEETFPWLVRHPSRLLDKIAFPWAKDSNEDSFKKDPFLFIKNYRVIDTESMAIIQPTSNALWTYANKYCPQGVCSVKESRYQILADVVRSAETKGGFDVSIVYEFKDGRAGLGEYHFNKEEGMQLTNFKIYDHLFETNFHWLMNYRAKP